MTDNFETIKQFIQTVEPDFDLDDDKFYTVEIISRKTDNPEQKGDQHSIRVYYINSIAGLDKYRNEIIKLCEVFNARAYISVNCKSYEAVTKANLVELANRIQHDDFKKPYSLFESCAGKYTNRSKQLWILDVDKDNADRMNMSVDDLVDFYKRIIEKECKPYKPIVYVIPTKTGKHIICHPFDTVKFFDGFPIGVSQEALIKKNNPTLLYCS